MLIVGLVLPLGIREMCADSKRMLTEHCFHFCTVPILHSKETEGNDKLVRPLSSTVYACYFLSYRNISASLILHFYAQICYFFLLSS